MASGLDRQHLLKEFDETCHVPLYRHILSIEYIKSNYPHFIYSKTSLYPLINCQTRLLPYFPMSRFLQYKIPWLKLQTSLTPSATHLKKKTCLFMHKFRSNFCHETLCRYRLADQRCHRLIMREINNTAVVQIIAVNNAH